MKQDYKNQLTLDDFITLASQVKEWKRNDKDYYDAPSPFKLYSATYILGSKYIGTLELNKTKLDIILYNYSSTYGIFFSDKNDPFFIKGDTSDAVSLLHKTYVPSEHHIHMSTKDVNCTPIMDLYSKAWHFVNELDRKAEENRRRKEREREKIHEQEKNKRTKRIVEETTLLKYYIADLRNNQ